KINIDLSALDVKELGLNLDKGLALGIEDHAPIVLEAVEEMAANTISATKKSFGIQSPSTKFRVFGLNIIQGLIGGIKNNARLVVETVKNVFNTANKQAKKES
ncbi:MAG: hypothetical protein ACKPGB_30860, partial [Dolichospermum sp.]